MNDFKQVLLANCCYRDGFKVICSKPKLLFSANVTQSLIAETIKFYLADQISHSAFCKLELEHSGKLYCSK